ncbi:MAG: hypothetical protein QHH15_04080 [Candidatus Thermoplasmatota archaeon]|jgi:hypothetical protein|nr:hypothetical protein [Candidatus Thermoplasmatota archaeon]
MKIKKTNFKKSLLFKKKAIASFFFILVIVMFITVSSVNSHYEFNKKTIDDLDFVRLV